jgi:hypothetical protein
MIKYILFSSIYYILSFICIWSINNLTIGIIGIINNNILIGVNGFLNFIISIALYKLSTTCYDLLHLEELYNSLKIENKELKRVKDELIIIKDDMKKNMTEEIEILRTMVGVVGDDLEAIMDNFKQVYEKIKKENNKHARLLKAQTSVQLINLFKHFDEDNDLKLSSVELNNAKKIILLILPELKWDEIISKIKNKKLTLSETLNILLD